VPQAQAHIALDRDRPFERDQLAQAVLQRAHAASTVFEGRV
jgi:hypothetical protein